MTIWGPASDWERLLAVLAEVVLRPRFDPGDVARVRRQVFERQLREMTQPGNRAERELLSLMFPHGHPYRATGLGTRRSVSRVARADLLRFHRDHYTSGDAILVLTAPARRPAIERAARRLFRGFSRSSAPALRLPRVPSRPPRQRIVHLAGRTQVEVRIGGPSIARSAPEYPAAILANEVLGGRPLLSRLFQRVREKGGLAYHASSEIEAMRYGGYWVAQAGTGTDRWRKVVPMLAEEVRRIRSTALSPAELDEIRESAIGEIPLALESTADAHELAVDVAYHRLPGDYWIRWPQELRAVRPSDVRAAAGVALDLGHAVTVLAGPIRGS